MQYPTNFLSKAYELIRERGGLCVADEVRHFPCQSYIIIINSAAIFSPGHPYIESSTVLSDYINQWILH